MAAIKLTKTEHKMLALASNNPGGAIKTTRVEGAASRNLQAIKSLRVKGLLTLTNYYTEWGYRWDGRREIYDITVDAITDEGRRALDTL
jgi:hypothetical protein